MDQNKLFAENVSRSIPEWVQEVLLKMISQYNEPKIAYRLISKKIGLHEKTLQRLIDKQNSPTAQTVLKIFKVFYNEFNDQLVLDLVPRDVAEFLKENLVINYSEKENTNFSEKVDQKIQNNPIYAEIYVLAGTGPIQHDEIQLRYGLFGLEILKQMLESKVLKEIHPNVFSIGENQASFLDHTVLKTGLLLAKNYAKVINGQELNQNYISFFAEGLSKETYKKWIQIDQEAFRKKTALIKDKNNLGSHRVFTFQVTDTLEMKEKG